MEKRIIKTGYWSALMAFVATLSFVIVQLLQIAGVFQFPWDEILIYGTSLCIMIPFVIAMLALHYTTPAERRFWTHGALIFTIFYAVFVTANYVVQLATVIPMKIKGLVSEVAILEQTPHSMFWDYDALGYIFMGIAMLFALPALNKQGAQKWVHYGFMANALVTPLISFVYFYPGFTVGLLFLGFPWAVTAPLAMLALALMFKKQI